MMWYYVVHLLVMMKCGHNNNNIFLLVSLYLSILMERIDLYTMRKNIIKNNRSDKKFIII